MAAPWPEGDETSTVSLKILKGYKGYKSREWFWFKLIHSSFVWFVCIVISCGILDFFIFIKKWMPICGICWRYYSSIQICHFSSPSEFLSRNLWCVKVTNEGRRGGTLQFHGEAPQLSDGGPCNFLMFFFSEAPGMALICFDVLTW